MSETETEQDLTPTNLNVLFPYSVEAGYEEGKVLFSYCGISQNQVCPEVCSMVRKHYSWVHILKWQECNRIVLTAFKVDPDPVKALVAVRARWADLLKSGVLSFLWTGPRHAV